MIIYRLLIVDDESVDLEWMKRRIHSSGKRLEVAAAVNNALEALEIIKNERVDIILSDIRMPIMSGMEFIQQVKQINGQIKVMFISGHKEFEYAKQAVDFNAFGYLLKPVEDQELSDKLDAVIRDLDIEHDRNEVTQQFNKTFSLVKQELLFRWLEGHHQLAPQSASELEEQILALGAAVAVMEVDQMDWRVAKEGADNWQEVYTEVCQFVVQYIQEREWGYCIQGEQQRRTLLLFGEESTHGTRTNELIVQVGQVFPLTLTIGLGFHTDDPLELPLSYSAAKTALASKWYAGKNKTLTQGESSGALNAYMYNEDEQFSEIIQALENYNLTVIDDWIELLFHQLQHVESQNAVFQYLVHSIIRLNEQFLTLNENFNELMDWETPFPSNLLEFETVLDMKSWLRRKFFAFSEKWYLKKQNQKRKFISVMMQYVADHIDQMVTLKNVADHLGFSANYLGHLFKQETGQHFSSYIIEQRIKKACELLQNPTMKIYEISERIGYKNIIYFNKQFKQLKGISPGDYRKQLHI